MVLSIFVGVIALDYPLQPIHLTVLSWFSIGIPAFFLALEPNSERVHAGFLQRVLGWAVPAGVVIAGLTMAVFEIVQLDAQIDVDQARTAGVLTAGSIALLNLYRVARPLNLMRAVLVISMATLFVLFFVFPFTRDIFELPVTEWWAYVVAAAAIAVGYPLLVLGSWISATIYQRRTARRTIPA
jgi:cation-transporting ATPase E